jgi:hypothetical protein
MTSTRLVNQLASSKLHWGFGIQTKQSFFGPILYELFDLTELNIEQGSKSCPIHKVTTVLSRSIYRAYKP